MSNWSGDWHLSSTKITYQDLVTPSGELNLQEITGLPGVYKVSRSQRPGAAKLDPAWASCVLLERAGTPGPMLPTPLPATTTIAEKKAAEKTLREAIQEGWLSTHIFERLEGDVVNSAGQKRGVVLFKARQAAAGGVELLVAVWLENLNGNTSPDGSGIGVRR